MSAFSIFINFNGNCREAVNFYAKVFKCEEPKFMTFGDMPQNPDFPIDGEDKNKVLYTMLMIKGIPVMFSDVPKGMPINMGNNISITISSKDQEEIKTLFNEMSEGGTLLMELQKTFWSDCYGYLTDKFGVNWQFSHDDGRSYS